MAKHQTRKRIIPLSVCLLSAACIAAFPQAHHPEDVWEELPQVDSVHDPPRQIGVYPSERPLSSPLGNECTESTGCAPGCANIYRGVCEPVDGQCMCNIATSAPRFIETADDSHPFDAIQAKLEDRYKEWYEVAANSGDEKLEKEAEEMKKVDYKAMITDGLKKAASADTLKALASGDGAKIAEAVLGIAATLTAFIPVVGPFVSIGLVFTSSLIELFAGPKPTPQIPQITIEQIGAAMQTELQKHDEAQLTQYEMPTAMEAVRGRISYLQDTFIDAGNGEIHFDTKKAQDFISYMDQEVFGQICAAGLGNPWGTMNTLKLDIKKNIQAIPDEFQNTNNVAPMCDNNGQTENHQSVADNMAKFHQNLVNKQGLISLFDTALNQYVTLFGMIHRIFAKQQHVCVKDVHWWCNKGDELIALWEDKRRRFLTDCHLDGLMQASSVFHRVMTPELYTSMTDNLGDKDNNIGNLGQLIKTVKAFVEDSNQAQWVRTIQDTGSACQNSCDKMIGMQQSFLTTLRWSLDIREHPSCTNSKWAQGAVTLRQLGSPVNSPTAPQGNSPEKFLKYEDHMEWCWDPPASQYWWYTFPTIENPNSCFANIVQLI